MSPDISSHEENAQIFKALAHPMRLWIVEKLRAGECCVCEFVDVAGFDFSTVSRHLTMMKQAGIVSSEKRGKYVYYRLSMPCLPPLLDCLGKDFIQK